MKECFRCKILKNESDFHKDKNRSDGLFSYCKNCVLEKQKKYNAENRLKIKEYRKVYNKKNAVIIAENIKEYYTKNKSVILTQCRDYRELNPKKIKDRQKKYYENNKEEIIKKTSEYRNIRLKTDSLFRLKKIIRTRVTNSIKIKGYTKKSKTFEILGCDYEFFRNYIETQFKKGMTWNNIHLDHIKPLSTAKTEKEVLELNHYTNFQPLFAKDNLKKSNKLIEKQLRIL